MTAHILSYRRIRRYLALSLKATEEHVTLVMWDPLNWNVLYYKYVKEKHNKKQAMKENKFFAETFRMEEYGIFSGYGTTVYI